MDSLKIPKFKIDGDYLKSKGVVEGKKMGNILKILEAYWIKNNFSITEKEIDNILKKI